jgi:O-antigen/teichoic acid export membrane protein
MRSLVWLVGSRGGMQSLSFLSTLLVMRLLHPADYGVIALAGIWTSVLAVSVELGLNHALVVYRDLDDADLSACFWLALGLAVAAYAALFAGAPALGSWFGSATLPGVMRVTGLTIVITAVRLVPESLLRKRLRLDRVSQAEMVASAASLVVVLALALTGAGVWALAAGIVAMQSVQTVLAFGFARWVPGAVAGATRVPELLRFGLSALGGGMCWIAYQQADTFVLGKLTGDVTVGLYAMARQLAVVVAEKVSVLVNQLAAPLMAAQQDDVDGLGRSLVRGLRCVAWLTFPMAAGILLTGDLLVGLLLTEKWLPALPILYVLCAWAAIESLAILLPPVLHARFQVDVVSRYYLALAVALPAAFWAGARLGGAIGVAAVWAVVYPLFPVWLARRVLREIGMPWRALVAELGRPLAATLLMVVLTFPARRAAEAVLVPGGVLAVTVGAGIATYLAGVGFLGGSLRGDLREVLAWIGRGRRCVVAVEGR